jgi:parvulin-like peptidyl-prolyl isomerase
MGVCIIVFAWVLLMGCFIAIAIHAVCEVRNMDMKLVCLTARVDATMTEIKRINEDLQYIGEHFIQRQEAQDMVDAITPENINRADEEDTDIPALNKIKKEINDLPLDFSK